jgi:hypothetical protein
MSSPQGQLAAKMRGCLNRGEVRQDPVVTCSAVKLGGCVEGSWSDGGAPRHLEKSSRAEDEDSASQ